MSSDSLTRVAGASVRARGWGWRHFSRRALALSGLDISIDPGERVLLLGASGAGKSTFLAALAGVLGGDEEGEHFGELTVDGRAPQEVRGRVGLVLQDPDSQVILGRIGDDVAFGCENLGVARAEIWPRVSASLRAVGLELPLDASTSALSGGQKQRLALAGVLAMRPGLVLLDEPTANLDPDGVVEVRNAVVRTVAETGATLIVIEHRVSIWKDFVDRVIVLDADAGLLADGPTEPVLRDQAGRLREAGVWVPGLAVTPPIRRSTPGSPLLGAEALDVARPVFGQRHSPAVARAIDFQLRQGQSTVITGANGSGKSTLALTIAGLLPVSAGTLRAEEALAGGAGPVPARWKSKQLLTRIGTVFQDPEHQFLASTVRSELTVGPRALGLSAHAVEQRTAELLARLRLAALAEANPFTLSGGEKRRLSVATVLATRPALLVLDEPTFGQDSRTWGELVSILAELLDDGIAVCSVTHDADFVAALGDQQLRLGTVDRQR